MTDSGSFRFKLFDRLSEYSDLAGATCLLSEWSELLGVLTPPSLLLALLLLLSGLLLESDNCIVAVLVCVVVVGCSLFAAATEES